MQALFPLERVDACNEIDDAEGAMAREETGGRDLMVDGGKRNFSLASPTDRVLVVACSYSVVENTLIN